MKERVYLGDWAYNAGIIGFIEIMLDGEDIDSQNIITIGLNYIEFERESLRGFSDKFFKKAYQRYPRTDEIINEGKDLLEQLNNRSDIDEQQRERIRKFKDRVNGFAKLSRLAKEYGCSLNKKFNKNEAVDFVNTIIKILEDRKQEFMENDVKVYLNSVSSVYGEASFLNRQITENLKEKFYNDFEKPIIEKANEEDKKYPCIFCGERKAKKGAMFNTGIVNFLGANKDNKNFFWNFKPQLPICEICELMYFCIFAALTEFRVGQTKRFYFVDKSTSVLELYQANKLFMEIMSKEENLLKDKGILNFINDYLLLKLREESKFALTNVLFVEIDLSSVAPKVYGFNISKQKAEFVTSNYEFFENVVGTKITVKDNTLYPFHELLQRFLNNTLSFQFVSFLESQFISSKKVNSKIKTNLSPYRLQMFNIITYKFLKSIKRGEMLMDEKSLWRMYFFGQELKKTFLKSGAENKITSLAYRLISALRIGDINTFMNLVIRTYMNYNMEVPALFVSCINDKDNFCALGYSFVNGLLGSERDERLENEEDEEK
ncbi:CRISPR-associated protein Cst1 [Caldicellulosiruptor bescii]|uniref:CRISPR-associated CXXC_CXXC protein Cst1 n=2 Tax=Caldicellulosiruptor bescii TaxID=31899 RepID=B9MLS2_CALBD|nr:type I-B CRISPR-associated protein Cas8b1/Cst1 [Caldicellulosiruptor bescii]ACM59280.1 CRISPR-associated CXXC_CXXC protein Cst1 [Caldicellulosiruptor bescii DSM 6725]PBC88263.1 CRISPR-associated protein Cst1 [Caldicellulosiruptor bescii]PBC92256.1 CRISPR-associated protein Cst1 [Caldicellulosiruptor bescii]PBD04935.1 CRISPR-associated protein Cst1 [Caldicellulosiruptor bescii]PBD05435.1 CRISPR-associated protein Cst1 [Caldicellulosiruptor bescii]